LNASEKPTILAINKIDCMESEILQTLRETLSGYIIVEISAKHHTNIDILLQKIEKVLPQKTERKVYLIPYQETALVAYLHRIAVVEQETYVDAGILIHCLINQKNSDKMERYQVFSEKEEFLLDENAKV
jgi:GTP-binding protein HflX